MPGTAQRPGKRDLFCPPPTPSFLLLQLTNGGDGESKRRRWRVRGVGAWQTGCEQRVEKDADVKAMNLGTPMLPPLLPLHLSPSPSTPQHPLLHLFVFLSPFLSQCLSVRLACPVSAQSAAPPPSPGPRNYSLGWVIRVKWSDKSAVCRVCMHVCKSVCAKSLGIVTLTGSQAAFS